MTVNTVLALLFSIVVVVSSEGHNGDIAPTATCSSCCLQGPPGPPGVNGRDGLNGRDGRDGGMIGCNLEELRQVIRHIVKNEIKNTLSNVQSTKAIIPPSPVASTTTVTVSSLQIRATITTTVIVTLTLQPTTSPTPSPQPTTLQSTVTLPPSPSVASTPTAVLTGTITTTPQTCLIPAPPPQPTSQPLSCPVGLTKDNPASSCRDILTCNSSASSQNYWIRTESNVTRSLYCYMEADKCGVRGMMRVVNIDMTNPGVTCPSPLTLYNTSGKRFCGGSNPKGLTCSSVTFPTFNYRYTHVCGRAVGFSYHTPCGFHFSSGRSLEGAYVSGLSITHGEPGCRTHIWTYAGGFQESFSSSCNCPCAKYPGAPPPSYVGDNYYCESANHRPPSTPGQWFTDNALWDSQDCYPGSSCCNNTRAPWFVRELSAATRNDVEIHWCTGQGLRFNRVATELVEIYVY